MIGKKDFAAACDPFHRPADTARGPQDQRVLGVYEVLGAEAAADIGRDVAHFRRLDAQRAGGEVAVAVDVLAGDGERVAAARLVPLPDHAARLHRVHDDAMVVEVELDHMSGAPERRINRAVIAGLPVETEIARHFGRQLGRTGGERGGAGRHGRQRPIVDLDLLGGIERLRLGLGHDQRHRLAAEAHSVRREQRLDRELERLLGLQVGLDVGPQRLQPVGCGIGRRQHRKHARHGARRRRVDAPDLGMGMRRAEHDGAGEPLELQIVDVAAAARDEAGILAPLWVNRR